LARRKFSPGDQALFAGLSGDFNPVHLDPVAARRTQLGAPVVHGVHTVLWCLDVFARQFPAAGRMSALNVRLSRPIYEDEMPSIVMTQQAADQIRLRVQVDDVIVATIRIGLGGPPPALPPSRAAPNDDGAGALRTLARDIGLDEMRGMSGAIRPAADAGAMAEIFPAAAGWIGPSRLQGLAQLSRLVGMECPGLHSILSSINVESVAEGVAGIRYRVTDVDPDFRIVRMEIGGCGLFGTVEAFVRIPPVSQLSMKEVAARVHEGEFASQQVLIIGASRGLGELTAKIIAAGGGCPTITYAVGEADAAAVAAEIRAAGRRCEILRYDARQPAAPQLAALQGPPTHLYYFATSRILRRKRPSFDAELFREFVNLYLLGFFDVCQALAARGSTPLRAFVPSSSMITADERPAGLTEYAMAKAAAEVLCADMDRFIPGIRVLVRRLPRLLTDQTATLTATGITPPIDVLFSVIREMQSG
jgi:NAD(P)-dependent dehydrogenase (short-subunit alcohol dehydrogenase family)